ncbi:nuclear transport factor 2 family protein [Brevundimonas sp. SL161]|uniref:nuclear transport factor 2 family protein n=1 Tax=Brevundimonas sp. SL161 TaxID=2804613 RepID=UPI003CEA3E8C
MTLLALAAALAIQTTMPADPASAEAAAVMVPVNAVFAALAARDGALVTPHLDPEARLTAVVARPDGTQIIRRMSGAEFAGGLQPGGPALEEVMPDPIIVIDGDVAVVWGRYLFKIDGAISHCGSDHFDLIRKDGVWLIAGLTWNQRTTGCQG